MSRTLKYGLSLLAAVAAINLVIFLVALTLFATYDLNWVGAILLFLVGSLLSASAITMATVVSAPVLRDYLITLRRLWRLENLSHPLLVRLSQEAPSTYHHSIIVANLSYRAAKAIGADPILARVGGYYHDIGKLAAPEVYIENAPDSNLLQKLNPKKAAKIITAHVKEGLKLAKKYDFPPEITGFITQHHGTTMASFFYRLAKEKGLVVAKQDFRYPGPKPLSKEAAIVMLADSAEAKIRSIAEFSDRSIGLAIDSIIQDKASDDQLELSGLMPRDVRRIRQAFIETIKVMHHKRIRYSQDEIEDFKSIDQAS